MIFKNIKELKNNEDKKFFVEYIKNFIKLIKISSNIVNTYNNNINEDKIILELKSIGIIKEKDELLFLEKILKKELYNEFLESVNILVENNNIKDININKFYNSYRKLEQEKIKSENKPKIVDFFCGAGGLSLGFIQEGYQVVLANDIERVAIETYKYNHPEIPSNKVIQGDIKEILKNMKELVKEKIDVVIGGPPCQGFSSANRQRIIDDPRNELYKYFIEAIKVIKPKLVVMENVKGMLKVANQVVEDYKNIKLNIDNKEISYDIEYKLLNSNDFGVAQNRERLIYIAIRKDIAEKNNIKIHEVFEKIMENKISKQFVLKDALEFIDSLEAPREKNKTEEDSEISGEKIKKNQFIGNENEYLKEINLGREIPIIFNHKARYCSDLNYEIYKLLGQGEDATSERIAHIMPYSHRNHIFKDKYFKLIENKPSRTITAHLKMDCHSHIHPTQIRSITPREAARIQSFPDDYFFLGPYLKTYMQIGNAVPPLLARAIAKSLKKYL